ncbi:MAG: AAC(3) family N-acetyltransferase [Lentisphaerae bacterium]|nr:AAC(3) family N-acetyltransferase [Lentisphaerota bacterium]
MNSQELSAALRELGLQRGDIVLLHSSFISLGEFEGGPEAVVEAFLHVLGPKGTLLAPVFGDLGILTSVVRQHPKAVVSTAPVGTLAAIGAKAKEICEDHWKAETAHGEGTPFLKLADLGGYVCLLGVDQDRNTTLHSAEALLRLPYLGTATSKFTAPNGKRLTKVWKYYPGPHRDFIGLDHYFLESGIMTKQRIGNAEVRLLKARDMIDLCLEIGQNDPAFALCDNPNCEACVRQRADIFAHRIKTQESFRLSASSRLAGRYVPEIIDNLKANGLSAVELDFLRGRSAVSLPVDKLTGVVAEFAAAGITVSALRAPAIPADIDRMLATIRDAGISRIILPFPYFEDTLNKIIGTGMSVSFVNTGQATVDIVRMITNIRKKLSCNCSFTFNPKNFVLANESPFLYSWRVGRFIKTIVQLDILDASWDTVSTDLACGNAEIKELVSIMRCHNFSGWFTLGGGGSYPGSLKDAVRAFTNLLDTI